MRLSVARAIAFDILVRVESEGAYASELLHAELGAPGSSRGASVKPEDAALATEITLGVLRWRRLLDFLLAPQLNKPIERLDLAVTITLRMGLYQLRFLERIPARAAVNESVELVRRAKKSSAAPLVNAVLRRATAERTAGDLRNENAEEDLSRPALARPALSAVERAQLDSLDYAEHLAILHSHPTWLVERWLARFGEERTLALLDANNRPQRLSCAVHDGENQQQIVASLARSGLHVEPGALLKSAFAVSGGSVVRTEAFRSGLISIQDEASQSIPLLVDARPGNRVLDLCAAPGGKTPPLARAVGPGGIVIAADRHAHRLRAMRAQFERVHLGKIQIIELDAEKPLPFAHKFDRILVDVPCSGTGTLARHPEIRWRLGPDQLAEFHALQVAILSSALDALAPGGRLVYSTCSLEPEENELVIASLLACVDVANVANVPEVGHLFKGEALSLSAPPPSKDTSAQRSHVTAVGAALSLPAVAGPARADHERTGDISLASAAETIAALAPHVASAVDAASLFDSNGFFRTLPGTRPTDGFFAAILKKEARQSDRPTSEGY
jgi:16S rRNA (cytosine967-C5)-methyltransferase